MSRIAIIGSGISGMGCTYLLHRAGHDVTLYEKQREIGGHTRGRIVQYGDRSISVDTGFIVFNHLTYPNLCGMFQFLKVPTEKSDMTFSITVNDGQLEWGAKNLNAVFGQRSNLLNPAFYGFIRDILRFNLRAVKVAEANPELTLGGLLEKLGTGDWYAKYFILPIGGAIWSCSLEQMLSFPARFFTRFFESHHLLSIIGQPQWYTVTGSSREYVRRLTANYAGRIRTSCGITNIIREAEKVIITDDQGSSEAYDHVVLACHADQALAMLGDATDAEREILSPFHYSTNHMVLHKDSSIMPKNKRCWASWVYHADESKAAPSVIPITYWMNLLQNIDHEYPLFVTLNPLREIPDEHIFERHVFEHPIYTPEVMTSQARLPEIQGKRRTWFCGAHWRHGFHEDGLASAVAVAKMLGAHVPWE